MKFVFDQRQRERWAFLHDAALGGEFWRYPSAPTIGTARLRWPDGVDESGHQVFRERSYRSYLVPFPAESDRSYETRLACATLINPCEPILAAYVDGVTSGVSRSFDALAAFAENANGRGGTWSEFVEDVAFWACVYGVVAVVVDAPRDGGLPYAYVVHPSAWAWIDIADNGELTEFAWVDAPYRHAQVQTTVRVRAVTATEWRTYQMDWTALLNERIPNVFEVVPNALGVLPVTFAFYRRLTYTPVPLGLSLISHAADITHAIYQTRSWADQIAREAGFPTLVIPAPATGGYLDPQTRVTIGPSKAIGYSAQSGAPQWIQPSAEWVMELRRQIYDDYQFALRSAGIELAVDQSAQVQSGVALRIRSRDFESRAKRFARALAAWERATLNIVAKYMVTEDDTQIVYPSRFVLPDMSADLERAMRLLRDLPLEIGPTAKLQAMLQAIDSAVALTEEQRARVLAELHALFEADAEDWASERRVLLAERAAKLRALERESDGEA